MRVPWQIRVCYRCTATEYVWRGPVFFVRDAARSTHDNYIIFFFPYHSESMFAYRNGDPTSSDPQTTLSPNLTAQILSRRERTVWELEPGQTYWRSPPLDASE